jgi:AcrR family transcriptional regulator
LARTRGKAAREPLSRERIEEAALRVIEREGYDGFSMRKLAADLGCEAMSIYHYFPSMAHLRDALLDRLLAKIPIPSRDLPWIERLRQLAYGYRQFALDHPRFFQHAVLHRHNTATGLRLLENFLTVLDDAGFDTESVARLFRSLGYYIAGAALDEAAGYAKGPSAVEPAPETVVASDYPLITAVNPYFKPKHHRETFETGLEMMLSGIERAHAARTSAGSRRNVRRGGGPPRRGRHRPSR